MPVGVRFRPSEEQEKGQHLFTMQHTLSVINALISARLVSNAHANIALTRLVTEGELKRLIYVRLPDQKLCLEPDASCQFHITETGSASPKTWEDFFHIEYYRSHLGEWWYKQKVQGYLAYIQSGVHEQHFGTTAFSLAVIAHPPELAATLKRWTEEVLDSLQQPEQGERFFFCSVNPTTASPEELFLPPVWEQAFRTAKTPLIALE
jgi:hypothetical protein